MPSGPRHDCAAGFPLARAPAVRNRGQVKPGPASGMPRTSCAKTMHCRARIALGLLALGQNARMRRGGAPGLLASSRRRRCQHQDHPGALGWKSGLACTFMAVFLRAGKKKRPRVKPVSVGLNTNSGVVWAMSCSQFCVSEPCVIRLSLLARFLQAADDHANLTSRLVAVVGTREEGTFQKELRRCEEAKNRCAKLCEEMREHQVQHGC